MADEITVTITGDDDMSPETKAALAEAAKLVYDKVMEQISIEIDAMLVCPECGDGLSLHIPDGWSRMDLWECDDCRCHAASSKWFWTVDELDDIYEAKQEAAKCNSQ